MKSNNASLPQQAQHPTQTGVHPVIAASMRWFAPKAEAESRARVYDSLANNPCMCDEVREVYRQRAHDIRRAADEGVPA